jgi:outer membrane protein TolC
MKLSAQSIDSLIIEALINNPQLKALNYKIRASEFRVESTDTYPAPMIGIELSQAPLDNLNILDNAVSNNISISQMFPLGRKISAMTDVARKNVQIDLDKFEIYKTSLIAELKMSYYSLWFIDRKIELQKKNIELLNKLLNSIDILYQVNRISQADLLTIKSEVAANEVQLKILEQNRESEIYKLNKLLGRDLSSKEIFAEEKITLTKLKYTESDLAKLLSQQNPFLIMMQSMIEMNRAEIIATSKELIPDLMLSGMIMRMPRGMLLTSKTPPVMINGLGKTEIMFGLMASINLPFAPWSSRKFTAKEEELLASIKGIENERSDMEREIISELKSALVKLKTSDELMNLYSKNVIPSYELAVEAQTSAYQNYQTTINSVIDSYRMLLMQEMNYYMAIADYQMAWAEIEKMIGKEMADG